MIKLTKSTFYNEKQTKKALVSFIREAKQLSFGPECEKFEKRFAKWQERKHCIFVNSGSSANLAIIQALLNIGKLKQGDLIGFSALTWSTNTMPLIQLNLKPIPVDIELDTLNISSDQLLTTLKTYNLKALFITNLLGFCSDIDEIRKICDERKIILIEDNCESLGTRYKGKLLGNFGLASTFSFYVGHHMSTIEGGAICTDSDYLASMLLIVRAHGWDRNLSEKRQQKIRDKHKINSPFYSRYTFYDLGYNFRTTEINGFIGNIQLGFIDEIINRRNKNFFYMTDKIYKRTDLYYPIRSDHIDYLSSFAIPIICRSKNIKDMLVKKCTDKIEIRPIVGGDMTKQPFFTKHVSKFDSSPNAHFIHNQGLYVGNNPELTRKEMDTIVHIFTADI